MAKGWYIDVDTTDDFLDSPPIRYTDGTVPATGEELDNLADPAWRKTHGLPPLQPLPQPPDR